mmetsp:Transcript_22425/g.35213  ORF Transcript_22425/g.35213 Transcript_22425/m.35213 type:complete len:219 (-) Transcript_22425:283-939(-)
MPVTASWWPTYPSSFSNSHWPLGGGGRGCCQATSERSCEPVMRTLLWKTMAETAPVCTLTFSRGVSSVISGRFAPPFLRFSGYWGWKSCTLPLEPPAITRPHPAATDVTISALAPGRFCFPERKAQACACGRQTSVFRKSESVQMGSAVTRASSPPVSRKEGGSGSLGSATVSSARPNRALPPATAQLCVGSRPRVRHMWTVPSLPVENRKAPRRRRE